MFQIILDDLKKIFKNETFYFFKKKDILILGGTGIVGQYFIGFFFLLSNKFLQIVIGIEAELVLP